jgi:hypothetical protein
MPDEKKREKSESKEAQGKHMKLGRYFTRDSKTHGADAATAKANQLGMVTSPRDSTGSAL